MNKFYQIMMIAAVAFAVVGCDSLPSWMGGKSVEKPKLTGERIDVLPTDTALAPDPSLKGTSANLPAAVPNDNWTQHGGGFSAPNGNLAPGGHFDTISSVDAGNGESYENILIASPVVGGGLVFAMDQMDNISAHDATNINNVRWQYSGVVVDDKPPLSGGGLAYDQGKLYVVTGRGMVAAIDATTGREIWHKALHLPFRSAPKIADDKLFAITLDNQTYVLNIADGSVVWNHRGISESAGLMNSVSPTIEGNLIVVPYSSGEIYVLSISDGKEVWSESAAAGKHTQSNSLYEGIGGDPIVDGGVVLSASSGGSMSAQALSNGQHVWEDSIGTLNTPWVASDNLFLLTTDNTLLNLIKFTGKIRWSTKLQTYANVEDKKDPITWKGPVLVDGNLAIVGSNGQLLLVSAENGKIVSTKEIPEDIYTAPVVALGRMYLISQDAKLYSLK